MNQSPRGELHAVPHACLWLTYKMRLNRKFMDLLKAPPGGRGVCDVCLLVAAWFFA